MKNKSKIIYLFSVIILGIVALASCDKKDDDPDITKSTDKQIIGFRFDAFTPAVTATIDQNMHTITAVLPEGTNLTNLVPTVACSDKATVSPIPGTAVDFTNPVVYTVTAEDLTVNTYIVTITTLGSQVEVLSGELSENRTLPNVSSGIDYIIDGWLNIEGNALLTIEPGVKIVFANIYSGIKVGTNAGLKMSGTLEMPIILTGPVNNNNKGAWYGIEYNSNRADNVMNFVQIINAGASGSVGAVIINDNAQLKIANSIIDRSAQSGLFIYEGNLAEFNGNTIRDCDNFPIDADNMMNLQNLNANNAFIGNTNNMVNVNYSPQLEQNCIFKEITIPYLVNGFATNSNVVIEAGVNIKFKSQSIFDIYPSGKVSAIGTAQKPIIMEGLEGDAGYWGGIYLNSGRDNIISYCNISGGGYDTWNMRSNIAMWDNSKLTISNSVISNSTGYGFQYSSYITLSHSNVTFQTCALGNVYDYDNELVYVTLP